MQNGGEFNDEGHDQMHIFSRYMGDGFGWSCGSEEKDCKFRNSRANKKAFLTKHTFTHSISFPQAALTILLLNILLPHMLHIRD